MSRSRSVLGLVLAVGLWGCGGGGGGGGGGPDAGPVHWGVPFLTASGSQRLYVTFHNLSPSDATATLTPYAYDGTPGGVGAVALDGYDSQTLVFVGAPTTAWFLVTTPSREVEVSYAHTDPSGPVDEAARACPLGDLGAPPPTTTQSVAVTLDATSLRVTNASGAANVVTATAWASPAPGSDAVAGTSVPVALDPFETTFLDPSTFGTGFLGTVSFTSASPFFVTVVEGANDLAFDGVPPVTRRDRILHTDVAFGLDHAVPNAYNDFALILTNTSGSARQVELRQVRRTDGTAILLAPRSIGLGAHETRVVATTDAPLADLFGDATLAATLVRARLELFVPDDVDVSVRQFDPLVLLHLGTTRPQPSGHVVDVMGVLTEELLDVDARQWITVHNPNALEITVNVGVIVPQPDGFDAAPTPIATLTIPANGFVDLSPDGVAYLDRDAFAVDFVALRCTGANAFAVTGRRETRAANGVLTRWSSLITRSHDDAN